MEIVLFCDCGCGLIPESEKENETVRQMLNSMNAFRSYFESIGTAVILTDSFDTEERKKRTLDMSSVEIDAYTRMYAILSSLERYPSQTPADILMIMNGLKKLQSQEAQLLTVV